MTQETTVEEVTDEETADEEITTEEELETEREIVGYHAKIEALDARLAELKADKTTGIRRKAMEERGYSSDQVERYIRFIDGETEKEAKQSVSYLEVPPAHKTYINQTPMGGGNGRPKPRDAAEVGRSAIKRVIDKIRL